MKDISIVIGGHKSGDRFQICPLNQNITVNPEGN
jgi:hypothetical protein